MKRCLKPGKTRIPTCPCWWPQRRNTLRSNSLRFFEVQLSELYPSPLPLIDGWHAQAKMIAEGTQFGHRLIEKIGAGGMGEVYRALDTRLEREVALKLVSASYLSSDAGSGSPSPATPHSSHASHERFLREARSAATLNHPNVCSIHDTGEQDGRPYLVMELLRGVTLKKYSPTPGTWTALRTR